MTAYKEKGGQNKILILILLLLTAAFVLAGYMLYLLTADKPGQDERAKTVEEEKLHLFQTVPELALTDKEGRQVMPLDTDSEATVLLFWASWCPHCRDSVGAADALGQTAGENGAAFWLVNKLDGKKETRQQALSMLSEQQVKTESLFDDECRLYDRLGLNMIPTLLVLNGDRQITAISEGSVPTREQLAFMIREAREGKSAVLLEAVEEALLNEAGGIRTNYKNEGSEVPSGEDVLSESQGIFLEYAALTGRTKLFETIWRYTKDNLTKEGLMPWVVADNTEAKVNALIDDLRIAGALGMAAAASADYEEAYESYCDAVYTWNTNDGYPVDFYDADSGEKASRFTLCYGDLAVLSRMRTEKKEFKKVYDRTLKLILDGRISEKFPLYYSYYDYTTGKYEGSRLNMAEALTTLLHLAEAGELPEEALDWLEKEMEKGCLYAAYNIDGSPAKDGYYESTAVYAIAAMIALTKGREALAGQFINRMEQLRIREDGNMLNGLFGNYDGTGIYSFDQGMALLAWELYERISE